MAAPHPDQTIGTNDRNLTAAQPAAGRTAARQRNYPRWRAVSLSLVYVVFGLHIAHWRITGKTLAPLELNEVMYTLELGIITAGFLFMCALVIGTLIFGRFFCSWACHIIVLQDLCAWLLRKAGIRAKPIRSRLLLWVPPMTAWYMFVWPQLLRAWENKAWPTFHLATDREGWASFVTENFWRNLPGPWIIALTFVVCGFATVYILGSRSFCTYVCPYGAVFALADRFSPGKILVNDSCQQCGRCTAACTSGIRVHEETHRYGMVVNPACMKDLDCVSVCPQRALRYGFSRPALFKSYRSGRFGIAYEFTLAEEIVGAVVFLGALLSFRGLYNRIPFLLSLTLGVLFAYLTIQVMRLASRPAVRAANVSLKQAGRLTRAGWTYSVVFCLLWVFLIHSAFVRYHEHHGLRLALAARRMDGEARESLLRRACQHLHRAERWGIVTGERTERSLIFASADLGAYDDAMARARRYLAHRPRDEDVRLVLGKACLWQGRESEAAEQFEWIVSRAAYATGHQREVVASAAEELAGMAGRRKDYARAAAYLNVAIEAQDDRAKLHAMLGGALAELRRLDEAIQSLRTATRLDPALGEVHYNLGVLLAGTGRMNEAVEHYELALGLHPDDPDLCNNLGWALLRLNRGNEAEGHLRRALAINPRHADAHFNLALLLAGKGETREADAHMQAALRLNPQYARFLEAVQPSESPK